MIRQDDKINVMVMGIVPAPQSATIKLQFLDPEQFKKPAQQPDGTPAPAEVVTDEEEEAK